jgi:hypothetical protein
VALTWEPDPVFVIWPQRFAKLWRSIPVKTARLFFLTWFSQAAKPALLEVAPYASNVDFYPGSHD